MKKADLESLKKIATSEPLTAVVDDGDNFSKVNKFIRLFKIEEGKNKVMVGLIYKVYKDWTETPLSKKSFCNEFSKIFLSQVKNNRTYYELNYKPGMLVKKGQALVDLRITSKKGTI